MHNPSAIKSINLFSGLATGIFILFTADQLGPFAPLVVALGFYVFLFFTIQTIGFGVGCAYCKWRARRAAQALAKKVVVNA